MANIIEAPAARTELLPNLLSCPFAVGWGWRVGGLRRMLKLLAHKVEA